MGSELMLNNKCIVVLGMHRSGTSAITAVLSMLGAYPGQTLIPAKEGINPKGFWEHADVVAVQDDLLQTLGFTWYDERPLPEGWWLLPAVVPYYDRLKEIVLRDFSQRPLWILKDPRCCRLLPLWLDILKEVNCAPSFILMLRNPSEVVSSLTERAGFHEAKSYLLWLRYVLDSERWSRSYPRIVVTYDQLLTDWQSTANLIGKSLGVEWPLENQRVQQAIEEFLDSSLRHHDGNSDGFTQHLWQVIAQALYQEMISLQEDKVSSELRGVREVEANVAELEKLLSPLLHSLMKLKDENTYLRSQIESLHSEVTRIKSTFSWQITKPLRGVGNLTKLFRS